MDGRGRCAARIRRPGCAGGGFNCADGSGQAQQEGKGGEAKKGSGATWENEESELIGDGPKLTTWRSKEDATSDEEVVELKE